VWAGIQYGSSGSIIVRRGAVYVSALPSFEGKDNGPHLSSTFAPLTLRQLERAERMQVRPRCQKSRAALARRLSRRQHSRWTSIASNSPPLLTIYMENIISSRSWHAYRSGRGRSHWTSTHRSLETPLPAAVFKGALQNPTKGSAERPPVFDDRPGQTTLNRWQLVLRSLRSAFTLENFPFVVLVVLAALSLFSRLWLLLR
jgi:hypothetical protein